jgi:hypothetical protein
MLTKKISKKRSPGKEPRTTKKATKGKRPLATITLPPANVKNVIRKLITGKNFRDEITPYIDREFLKQAAEFLIKVFMAKINIGLISDDWYEQEFLSSSLSKEKIAANAGLGMKTIKNAYDSTKKEVVIKASTTHYESLKLLLKELSKDKQLEVLITISYKGVSAQLTFEEGLIAINALATIKGTIRGGVWSSVGKQVEKPLMSTLCRVFKVKEKHFKQEGLPDSMREVDFYLINSSTFNKCEVKLMGAGNPESADGALARQVKVLIADKLSKKMKDGLDKKGIDWIELRSENGYKKFENILSNLGISYESFDGNIEEAVKEAITLLPEKDIPKEIVVENSDNDRVELNESE